MEPELQDCEHLERYGGKIYLESCSFWHETEAIMVMKLVETRLDAD